MIDNNHLAYAGVIVVFLLGLTVVALVGMFCLAVGFAVSMTVRFRKRQARNKRLNAAAPVPVTKKDGIPRYPWIVLMRAPMVKAGVGVEQQTCLRS